MPEVPDNAKKPTDRKSKSAPAEECFSFEHAGETYTFKPTYEHLTPGFLRKNRRRDELDAFFTMLEELTDEDTLEVIDNMGQKEFNELSESFYKHLEVAGAGE